MSKSTTQSSSNSSRNTTTTTTSSNTKCYMPEEKLPPKRNREANSTHRFSRMDLQRAITDVKRFVESRLESDLKVVKHTSPMAFLRGTGVNDELDGTESKSAVRFTVPNRDIPRGIQLKEVEKVSSGISIIGSSSSSSTRRIGVGTSSNRKEDEHTNMNRNANVNDANNDYNDNEYEMECEIVQSLAKWKRIMLERLQCKVNEGIYCDSTSIRKGYKGDTTHSIVADQWDFEIRITKEQRTLHQLKDYVRILWKIVTDAEEMVLGKPEYRDKILGEDLDHHPHPTSSWRLPKEITFLTANELHRMYPGIGVHERETAAVRKYGAVFIIGMGWPLYDGSPAEEVRSPGYDDWNLNGDILVYHPLTEYRHELSSQGIRVDRDSLLKQLEHRGQLETERNLDYMKAVLEDRVPFSYGGGLGISRLLMLVLRTAHIGEVQVGLWHDDHYKQCAAAGIDLIPDRIISLD
jgi:aspartate--ammonia ligase